MPDPSAGRMLNLSVLSQMESNRALQDQRTAQNELIWLIDQAIAGGEISQSSVWQNIFDGAARLGMGYVETEQLIQMLQRSRGGG